MTEPAAIPADSPPPAAPLLRALRRLLRPLVRLLIRSGITFPILCDLLRGLYVTTAAEDMATDARARSDSRLTLLTGVHRKEIRRLREAAAPADEPPPAVVTLNSQLIARWLGLEAYTDEAGDPLPLPRAASPNGGPSFDALVASLTTDLRPRTVLDSWIDQGFASIGPDDRVRLNVSAFVPREGREAQLFYFARNLHDHLAAAAANVTSPASPPFLERSLHYDRLSPEAAARLEKAAREAARQLLVDLNRLALALVESENLASDAATRRVNFGVYLFTEAEPPRSDAP